MRLTTYVHEELKWLSIDTSKVGKVNWIDSPLAELAFANKRLSSAKSGRNLHLRQLGIPSGLTKTLEHEPIAGGVHRTRCTIASHARTVQPIPE
jgi:hypothetical protein